jgi:hypothetical protein
MIGARGLLRAAILPVGLAALPVQAAPTARQLLPAAYAGPSVAYSGVQRADVSLEKGKASASVRVSCNGKGALRREYGGGAAAGVVSLQVGRSVWQRSPDGAWVKLPAEAGWASGAEAAEAALRNYDVRQSPPVKLLGRTVVPLTLAPRAAYNPSRKLWVEPGTGILLRDELYAPDGRLRSSSVYTSLKVGPQAAGQFAPPTGASSPDLTGPSSFAARASAAQVRADTGSPAPQPGYVPPGYRPVLYGVVKTGSGRLMPAVRYSDGLAAFTLFQRGFGAGHGAGGRGFGRGRGRGQGGPPWARQANQGPECVAESDLQRATVTVGTSRANYLLVGDLAESELLRVGRSLP